MKLKDTLSGFGIDRWKLDKKDKAAILYVHKALDEIDARELASLLKRKGFGDLNICYTTKNEDAGYLLLSEERFEEIRNRFLH